VGDSADNKSDSKEFRFDSIHWQWCRGKETKESDGAVAHPKFYAAEKYSEIFFCHKMLAKK